jgi:hypothetical protein
MLWPPTQLATLIIPGTICACYDKYIIWTGFLASNYPPPTKIEILTSQLCKDLLRKNVTPNILIFRFTTKVPYGLLWYYLHRSYSKSCCHLSNHSYNISCWWCMTYVVHSLFLVGFVLLDLVCLFVLFLLAIVLSVSVLRKNVTPNILIFRFTLITQKAQKTLQ